MNYDNWKLAESPSEEIPHPYSCVGRIGHTIEFLIKRKPYKGIVFLADNERVGIKTFDGQVYTFYLDDLQPVEEKR